MTAVVVWSVLNAAASGLLTFMGYRLRQEMVAWRANVAGWQTELETWRARCTEMDAWMEREFEEINRLHTQAREHLDELARKRSLS